MLEIGFSPVYIRKIIFVRKKKDPQVGLFILQLSRLDKNTVTISDFNAHKLFFWEEPNISNSVS